MDWSKLTSSEFILAVGSAIASWAVYLAGIVPAEYAVYVTVGATVLFALSRGLAKYSSDLKTGYKSREFWLALAGILLVVITAIPGVVSPELATAAGGTIIAGYVLSRGLSKDPEFETDPEAFMLVDSPYETTGSGDEAVEEF